STSSNRHLDETKGSFWSPAARSNSSFWLITVTGKSPGFATPASVWLRVLYVQLSLCNCCASLTLCEAHRVAFLKTVSTNESASSLSRFGSFDVLEYSWRSAATMVDLPLPRPPIMTLRFE